MVLELNKRKDNAFNDMEWTVEIHQRVLYNYGMILNELKDPFKAIRVFENAISLSYSDSIKSKTHANLIIMKKKIKELYFDCVFNRGLAHYKADEYNEAIKDFTSFLTSFQTVFSPIKRKKRSHSEDIVINIKLMKMKVHESSNVIEDEKERFVQFCECLVKRGICYAQKNNKDFNYLSLKDFNRVISILLSKNIETLLKIGNKKSVNTDDETLRNLFFEALFNRGIIHRKMNNHSKAIKDFNTILECFKKICSKKVAKVIGGTVHEEEKKIFDEKKEFLNDFGIVNVCNEMAIAYEEIMDLSQALRSYNYAIQIIELHEGMLDLEKSVGFVNVSLKRICCSIFLNRCNLFLKMNEFEKALVDAETVLKLDPEFIQGYNKRGIIFGELKRIPESVEDFSKAIKLDNSNNSLFFINRANGYVLSKDYEKAINDYEEGIKIEMKRLNGEQLDKSSKIRSPIEKHIAFYNYELGSLLFSLGRFENAVEPLKIAVTIMTKCVIQSLNESDSCENRNCSICCSENDWLRDLLRAHTCNIIKIRNLTFH